MLHSRHPFTQLLPPIKPSLLLKSGALAIATLITFNSLPAWAQRYNVRTRGISTSPSYGSGPYGFDPFRGSYQGYQDFRGSRDGTIRNSVLVNPVVIDSTIQNSTLVNPVLVNPGVRSTPYYSGINPPTYYPGPSNCVWTGLQTQCW
jgi:hypothetical protein